MSWVRKGDGHLLAVGDDTFINDGRFQAQRIASSDTWTLQIRSVQLSDAGDYECQVSSNEPKISRIVHLRAVGKWNHFSCISLIHLLTLLLCWTWLGNNRSRAYYLSLLAYICQQLYCPNESHSITLTFIQNRWWTSKAPLTCTSKMEAQLPCTVKCHHFWSAQRTLNGGSMDHF